MRIMSQVMHGNEENVPVLEKTVKRCNERSNLMWTLPPNVSGNSRGFLDLSLDRIQWNVTSYPSVTARVVWWGENCDDAASIKITQYSRNCINYSVCTNTQLFRKYLASCEAIEVQFSSPNVNVKGKARQIGTAFISLPGELLMQDRDCFSAPVVYTNTHKIYSPRNTVVGTLKLTIKLVLFDDLKKNSDPLTEKNTDELYSLSPAKDYLSYKKERLIKRPDSIASYYSVNTSICGSKVWSFLRGKEMSPRDEVMTLRELTEASPANSVIEAMDEELTWKLRDFYSKRSRKEKLYKCHNPGTAAENEEGHSSNSNRDAAEKENSTTRSDYRSNGGSASDKSKSAQNEDLKTEETSPGKETAEEEYQGVFYIGGFRNQHPHNRVPNIFAVANSISNVDTQTMKTNVSDQNLFINYLKLFPIQIDANHLDTVMKQNTLTIELWTRYNTGQDVKMGSVAVGLHPFYVAFRSEIVRQRLFDLSMPVIAVDGWAMVQGPDGASIGQLEVILAMGTTRQVEYFVQTKELLNRRMEVTPPVSARSQETATSILSSFLENLSQQMAANKARQGQQEQEEQPKRGEMRKTSDLLDILHKSLTSPPPTGMMNGLMSLSPRTASHAADTPDSNGRHGGSQEYLKIFLEIESAMHLPKVNNKSGELLSARKKGKAKDDDQEPSAYATFEARITPENGQETVDSVEGKVFATHVVERSSNPVWNKQFTLEIPKDLLTHPEKYFIVKIWRKGGDNSDLLATPLTDTVIGFCTVDLKVLTAGLPEIAGCYNIVYFDGKCNGQLQLKLKPLEAIQRRDVLDTAEMEQVTLPLPMLELSLGEDLSLSRTLKRKFTELDEITQRLRARLHDVTSSELISSDDEFENYLNNSVDEVDEEELVPEKEECGDVVDAVKDDFNWLGNLTEMQRQFVEIDRQLQRSSQTLNDLLDRNAMPGTSGTSSAATYTNGGGASASTTVESLETALKDAVLSERPNTS